MWKLYYIVSFYVGAVTCLSVPPAGVAPKIKLNDGNSMPAFGLGTWLGFDGKGGVHKVTSDSVEKAVEAAIDIGYRHIDTAYIYFTEEQVGKAVNKKIKNGDVKREDVFITTKLWNDKHARQDVVPSLRESLAKLNLEYVDLYLVHWPISTYSNNTVNEIDYVETWQGMVEAKKLGLARSIGVCNFNVQQLERLINSSDVAPAVLQVEVNLNLQQEQLRQFSRDHGIAVMGYTPFGSLFPSKATSNSPPPRVDDPELVKLANRHGKTVPQIVLRYLFELGVVPIPKTVKKERLMENVDIFDFELQAEDKDLLKSFDRNYRTIDLRSFWATSKFYPFELDE
ncbi:aldo-keto reductase AKR2E4-like [Nymphalis io]|uniref:aldo-keto reductase AKR2E4-like n=1 Tax=Inachis io TaxID=171585 RepID=UPI002168809A|nr:aldo-keto reductase AKR2E4-like [Nymphalis io]